LIVVGILSGDAHPQTQGFSAAEDLAPLTRDARSAAKTSTAPSKIARLLQKLRRSPEDPVILNNLAVAYAADGQLDRAIETVRHAVEQDAASAAIRVNLAAIYDLTGQSELARSEAAEAVRLDAKNVRARGLLCELELVTGHLNVSADCYRDLNADFPGEYDFQIKYGVALMKADKLDDARDLLEKMLAAHDRDVRVMNVLASVHYMMKNYERSSELLRSAVELDPDEPRLRYNLGISYIAMKNRPAALSQYKLIKESSPELADMLYRSLFQKYILDVKK
jgi:tetratricopeptide (TPR) repeat protein